MPRPGQIEAQVPQVLRARHLRVRGSLEGRRVLASDVLEALRGLSRQRGQQVGNAVACPSVHSTLILAAALGQIGQAGPGPEQGIGHVRACT